MRYVNVSIIMVFRLVSKKVHQRLPTIQSLIDAKLLLKHEAERLQKIDDRTPHESTWTPLLWSLKLIQRARSEGKITIEAPVYASLVSGFDYIETSNRKILNYGWVNFPLAYTQVRREILLLSILPHENIVPISFHIWIFNKLE